MARVEMSMRNVIIIIAVIVLLASGSAYTVFSIVGGPWGGEAPKAASKSSERNNAPGPIYNAGTMTVNLSAHGMPSTRFVRAGVAFELDAEKARRQLEQREEQVKDKIISIVRQQTPESIASNEGMDALRRQLRDSLNEILSEGRVVEVYFFDLVVQ